METILKVIVGSHAHGLANEKSDVDYRGVFIYPTSKIVSLDFNFKKTLWVEGNEDDTSWELQHFLMMSTKSNPTVLETYLSPLSVSEKPHKYSEELRSLFPYVWSSEGVKNAFVGYGLNQRKKFLDNKDNRRAKYAAAYLRVLYNAYELLTTGKTFSVRIADTPVGETVRKFKNDDFTVGEVVQICEEWTEKVHEAYDKCKKKEPDMNKINEFLLKVRKECW